MSTEQPPTKGLKIVLDRTEEMKQKDEEISRLNQELGKMTETNKSLLSQDRESFLAEKKEAEREIHKEAPDSIAPLNPTNEEKLSIPMDGSEVPIDWVRGKNTSEVLDKIRMIKDSKAENAAEYQKIYDDICKKAFSGNGTFEVKSGFSKWEHVNGKVVPSRRKKEVVRIE